MRLHVSPTGTIPELTDTLIFERNNFLNLEERIPIQAMVSYPPAMHLHADSLVVIADDPRFQTTKTIFFDNKEGMSALDYDLSVEYFRSGANTTALTSRTASRAADKSNLKQNMLLEVKERANPLSTYNSILQYDSALVPTQGFGYGEEYPFSTATQFIAPANGFNLTHVQTWYDAGLVANSVVEVEIRIGGTSISSSKLLHVEQFEVNRVEPIDKGQYETFELSENQVFYPGEPFYVVFNYAVGVPYPQGAIHPVEEVPGRFTYYSGEGWFDLGSAGFGDHGYMVKALEKEANTKSWLSIDGPMSGSIEVGDTLHLDLTFNTIDAQEIDNFALLNIETNDPLHFQNAMSLHLRKNQGPQIISETESWMVRENERLEIDLIGKDFEGDAHQFTLSSDYSDLIFSSTSDSLHLVYTPGFDAQGLQEFVLQGEDAHGAVSKNVVKVYVENINRAPDSISYVPKTFVLKTGTSEIVTSDKMFHDKDGDFLSLQVQVQDPSIMKVFMGDGELSMVPVGVGETVISVVATDSYGATARNTFVAKVGQVMALTPEQQYGISVYPNPARNELKFKFADGQQLNKGKIRVYNMLGVALLNVDTSEWSGENAGKVQVSKLPQGMYLIEIELLGVVYTTHFIKQ